MSGATLAARRVPDAASLRDAFAADPRAADDLRRNLVFLAGDFLPCDPLACGPLACGPLACGVLAEGDMAGGVVA